MKKQNKTNNDSEKTGLTPIESKVFELIITRPDLSQREIAKKVKYSPAQIQRIVTSDKIQNALKDYQIEMLTNIVNGQFKAQRIASTELIKLVKHKNVYIRLSAVKFALSQRLTISDLSPELENADGIFFEGWGNPVNN